MKDEQKKLIKDLAFGFNLAGQVVGSFLLAVILGLYLDDFFNTKPIIIICLLILAFINVIKILIGVSKK